MELWTPTAQRVLLTEVQGHADEDNKAKPSIEICDEVDDRDDNISDGREDAEHYVAVEKKGDVSKFPLFISRGGNYFRKT